MLFIFDILFESHMVGRQVEEGIREEAVKKKSGQGQMVEMQVMKEGFYLSSNGESLLVYGRGSPMVGLIWK